MAQFVEKALPATGWRGWLADTAAAAALLTSVPIPSDWQVRASWPRAMRALPLIGLLVGGAAGGVMWLALLAGASPLLAALLATLAGVILTGALHEDGLADMADALGGRTRRQRLEIMRDVHAGTFAILALIFAIGLQAAALAVLAQKGPACAMMVLAAVHALSRASMVALAFRIRPARGEGMGHGVARPDGRVLAQAGLAALPPAFFLLLLPLGPVRATLALFLVIGVVGHGMAWLARKCFGGQTGDVLGATEVVTRTVGLLAPAMMMAAGT